MRLYGFACVIRRTVIILSHIKQTSGITCRLSLNNFVSENVPAVDAVSDFGHCMRTALFWVITQRVVAISYRNFGTTYRSRPHCSRSQNKVCSPNEYIEGRMWAVKMPQ